MKKSIGEILKEARLRAGIGQKRLAKKIGITHEQISRLERGVRGNPTIETLQRWAEGVGAELVIEFRFPDDPSPDREGGEE
jgi:transcriptional regulator with XRE-family HTH domain